MMQPREEWWQYSLVRNLSLVGLLVWRLTLKVLQIQGSFLFPTGSHTITYVGLLLDYVYKKKWRC